jgi:CRISPR-associated exonuclease Cas4
METAERLMFTVTDLKQHEYCARIVFYTYCLPLIRPTTFKMDAGIQAHELAPDLERRRNLKAYGLRDGAPLHCEREFDVWLESDELGLRGRVDMVITRRGAPLSSAAGAGEGPGVGVEIIPVEYKDSPGRGGPGWTLQLAAYGVMLEASRHLPVQRGFVYYLPQRRAHEFALTAELKARVAATVQVMREMIEFERMPPPVTQPAKCSACEFRRFCNDVSF